MVPRLFKGVHRPIVWVASILTLLGICVIYSASFRMGGGYAAKQATWALVAVSVFFVTGWIGYRSFLNVSYLIYALSLGLLVFVLGFGETHLGANRWLAVGPFAWQPSELAKVATILALAQYLGGRGVIEKQKRSFLMTLALVLVPMFLIMVQPDLGSALVFFPVLIAIVFFWGLRIRYLLSLAAIGLALIPRRIRSGQGTRPFNRKSRWAREDWWVRAGLPGRRPSSILFRNTTRTLSSAWWGRSLVFWAPSL